jgi:hypothetical protein
MNCILCRTRPAGSLEHIFPLAIGGTLTTNDLCTECNSHLGDHADADLINHLVIVIRRAELGLRGNSGRVPDALKEMMQGATLASDASQRFRISTAADGSPDLYLLYSEQSHITDAGVEKTIRLDPRDADRIPVIIQRERKRHGLEPLAQEALDALVTGAVLKGQTANPEIHARPSIDLVDYKAGVLKIAYELAYTWLGEGWLDDAEADVMRQVLRGQRRPEETQLRGSIQIGAVAPFILWKQDRHAHLAFIANMDGKLMLGVRVFDAVSGLVKVSANAARYPLAEGLEHGSFLRIDPVSGAITRTTMLDEVARIAS